MVRLDRLNSQMLVALVVIGPIVAILGAYVLLSLFSITDSLSPIAHWVTTLPSTVRGGVNDSLILLSIVALLGGLGVALSSVGLLLFKIFNRMRGNT